MSEALSRLIRSIPIHCVVEKTSPAHVYSGAGYMTTGAVQYPVEIRVWLSEDGVKASVVSERAALEVEGPFGSEEERSGFSKSVELEAKRRLESLLS